jgi:hypothetical protein
MANKSGNAYAFTSLCPILPGVPATAEPGLEGQTYVASLRYVLQRLSDHKQMSKVPNTYLSRCYVLDDVFYQGKPALLEQLKSKYLVFSANFHGELDDYLGGLWSALETEVRFVLGHCVGFSSVRDLAGFVAYMKKCQVKTTFFFNGSTDEPLAAQLKSLYLKQEFSKFAFENQGKTAADLQTAFRAFVARTRPDDTDSPTWKPGVSDLNQVVFQK